MPTTPSGFSYPNPSDAPDTAGDIYKLASSVDTFIGNYFTQNDWNPALGGGNGATIGSGANVFAGYDRFGRRFFLSGYIQFGSGGSFGTGRATVANLPVTIDPNRTSGKGDYVRNGQNGAGVALQFVPVNGNQLEIRPIKNLELGLGYDLGTPNNGDFFRFDISGIRA